MYKMIQERINNYDGYVFAAFILVLIQLIIPFAFALIIRGVMKHA